MTETRDPALTGVPVRRGGVVAKNSILISSRIPHARSWFRTLAGIGGYSSARPTGVLVGTYHNGACGVSFIDGHSESHKWLEGTTKVRNGNMGRMNVSKTPRDWQ